MVRCCCRISRCFSIEEARDTHDQEAALGAAAEDGEREADLPPVWLG